MLTRHTLEADLLVAGGGNASSEVADNHLRKRIHKIATPAPGTRLELEVLATHGAPLARVFEVRLYA